MKKTAAQVTPEITHEDDLDDMIDDTRAISIPPDPDDDHHSTRAVGYHGSRGSGSENDDGDNTAEKASTWQNDPNTKTFDHLIAFREHALSSAWNIKDDRYISVSGIPYRVVTGKQDSVSWAKVLRRQAYALVIYRTQGSNNQTAEMKEARLKPWIAIAWRVQNGGVVLPHQVDTLSPRHANHRFKSTIKEAIAPEERLVGNKTSVKITSLSNSKEMTALVDTGASMCCLHADKWKVTGQTVQFINKELSPNVITMPLKTQQLTKTADGGSEYRPVIELNIRINGHLLQGVQFNLNNRSSMECPMLLGRNGLEKGRFLVDPRIVHENVTDDDEFDIDIEAVYEALDDLYNSEDYAAIQKQNLLDQLLESDITMTDIANARKIVQE